MGKNAYRVVPCRDEESNSQDREESRERVITVQPCSVDNFNQNQNF